MEVKEREFDLIFFLLVLLPYHFFTHQVGSLVLHLARYFIDLTPHSSLVLLFIRAPPVVHSTRLFLFHPVYRCAVVLCFIIFTLRRLDDLTPAVDCFLRE